MGSNGVSVLPIGEKEGERDIRACREEKLDGVGKYDGADWDLHGCSPSKCDVANGFGINGRRTGSGEVVFKWLGKGHGGGDAGE